MGSRYNEHHCPLHVSARGTAAITAHFKAVIHQAAYDYGHAGYSGSFAEADGVNLRAGHIFDSEEEASNWLNENACKWGPIIIVPYLEIGNTLWLGGCWCSS